MSTRQALNRKAFNRQVFNRKAFNRKIDDYLFKIAHFLPRSRAIYHFCRHYMSRIDGNFQTNFYTNGEMRLLRSVLGQCRIAFDVGANVGDWSEIALTVNPHLQLHCFEPDPAAFQQLKERFFVDDRATVNQLGMGASSGEIAFHLFLEGSSQSSIYQRSIFEGHPTKIETIQIDTIDAYCERNGIDRIDFLKIDVEGHELAVLQGARHMLERGAIDYVQFEYGGTYIQARILLKDIFEIFGQYGYTLNKILADKLKPYYRYDELLENFQYQNWVAIKSDMQKRSESQDIHE